MEGQEMNLGLESLDPPNTHMFGVGSYRRGEEEKLDIWN